MLESLRSRVARIIAPPQTRRFDAAAGGRRASGFGTFNRTVSEVSAAAPVIRSRARYLANSNPHVSNAVGNWVAALVGTGITPTGDAEQVARFTAWADVADADGRTDFAGQQAEIARSLVVDGEAFVRIRINEAGVRTQLIPAEMVDEAHTVELRGGGYIVNGVEFSDSGERVAYWILPARPTDQFASYQAPVRVPATEILHIFKPIGIGQVRGVSWLAPIVVPASEFDAIVDALAVGVKVAALNCAFLIDQNGNAAGSVPFDGEQSGAVLESGLEPGVLRILPAGWDIKFNSPQQANETAAFLRFNLQMLASGMGLPEHMLSGDLSNANYSSLRAGLLPFRARVEQVQYGVLVPQLLNPVWRRVLFVDSLTGATGEPSRVEWLPPRWAQVDPLKDTEATVAEINAGLTSRKKAVAERGWNIEDLDAEIAADRQREIGLGLSFDLQPSSLAKDAPADAIDNA